MYPPTVSVIMAAYNAERTITEAVNSILNQSFSDLELIVCNDASTDKTSSVLENITDRRLKVIYNDVNSGPGFSRDRAIECARGTWISFTDADDNWTSDRLETMLRCANSKTSTMIIDDIIECHDTQKGMVPWRILRGVKPFGVFVGNKGAYIPVENYITSKRYLIKPLIPRNFIISHSIHHRIRPDSMEPVEDNDYFIKLIAHGIRLYFIPKPMYLYRITPYSATSQSKIHKIMKLVVESAKELFPSNSKEYNALEKKIIMVDRELQYMVFISSLKKTEFGKSLQILFKSPWIMLEFIRRSYNDVIYHIHRIWHGGRNRGTR